MLIKKTKTKQDRQTQVLPVPHQNHYVPSGTRTTEKQRRHIQKFII